MKKNLTQKIKYSNTSKFSILQILFVLLLTGFSNQKAGAQCTAQFTAMNDSVNPSIVYFIDLSSTSVGTISTYEWIFGDGSSSTQQNPTHVFAAPGVYSTCLVITTSLSCADTFCMAVTVPNGAPGISINDFGADSSGTLFCTAPAYTDFVMSGMANGFGLNDSVEVFVNYGDGTDTTFYLPIPQRFFFNVWSHVYLNSGTYTPTVIVSNGSVADTMTATSIIVNSNCGPLSGTVYLDNNLDCIFNSGDQTLANINVTLSVAGNIVAWTLTDSNGVYSFNVPNGMTYDVTVQLNNWYGGTYSVICPSGGSISVSTLPSAGNDFYLGCPNGYDLTGTINAWGIVPGRTGSVCVFAYDRFCGSPSGQVKVILDPLLTAIPDSGSTYTISGDTIIWNYNPSASYWSYCASVMTSSSASIGDSVCLTMIIEPVAGDANPSDNVIVYCTAVRTSYDPNDKAAIPAGQGANHAILPGTELTYTIRFQNTGTAEAYDIYILDTLDQNLDMSTYQVLASSHPMVPSVLQDNVLRFTFSNIMLPDSNTNEALSHGYVTYRISPKSGLADGSTIHNTAGIYFDFNPVVATNTTVHTIDYSLGLSTVKKSDGLRLSPNPASDIVHVKFLNKGNHSLKLINALGAEVYSVQGSEEDVQINTLNLPAGIYLMMAEQGTAIYSSRLVITH